MDAVLEIHLPMAESAAERYFALEESVTAALESGSLGSVDGNDVGQGEFTIFMIGPDGRALLRAVRALLPADLLHPGAYAVIRNEKDEEVAEEQIPLTEADVPEAERPTSWKPLSFGAIKGGNSADVEAFWVPLQRLWQALPTAPPSRARATQLIVIWHVAGEIWDKVDKDVSVKVESRQARILGATVPIRQRPRTMIECHALIRESLTRVLEMCQALLARKRLDWDLTDVERAINGIEMDAATKPGR